ITASQGRVSLDAVSSGVNADLGSTAPGFNFSQAELNTVTAQELTVNSTGSITVSQSITLDPLKVPTLALRESLSSANPGMIIDGTETEQPDLIVKNLLLQALGSIGAADDIDVQVQNLAFVNSNPSHVANPVVDISNTGALTIRSLSGTIASQNFDGSTTVSATGPLTVEANVT